MSYVTLTSKSSYASGYVFGFEEAIASLLLHKDYFSYVVFPA